MACTLQSLRIGRSFDVDYSQKSKSNGTALSAVEELKATPELKRPKGSVLMIYKLYKYRDKLVSLIDGSRGHYRVCCNTFPCTVIEYSHVAIFYFLEYFWISFRNCLGGNCTLSVLNCTDVKQAIMQIFKTTYMPQNHLGHTYYINCPLLFITDFPMYNIIDNLFTLSFTLVLRFRSPV